MDKWGDGSMFIKAVPNNRGKKGTYYCSLVESYREAGKIKHRTIQKFGLVDKEGVELLKAKYAYLIRQPKRKK